MTPKPELAGETIGIDLGTTYSCVGIWQGDKVEIKYRDVHARTLTNDVQYFPPKERVY